MDRVDVQWTGGGMGTGLSVMFFKDGTAPAHLGHLHDLFAAYAPNAPSTVSIKVPGSGLQVSVLGEVTGTWTGASPATVTGASAAAFAAGVGWRTRWFTDAVLNGHKVRGSTFFVPLSTGAYQADGTIADANVGNFQTAVNTFVTACAGDFVIWSRPKVKGAGGGFSSVTSGLLPDRVSWLKSRRT